MHSTGRSSAHSTGCDAWSASSASFADVPRFTLPRMRTCPACGHENLDSAKFCQECAAPLAQASTAREQRKTVTVLFCDVTGSTALGESTDPEAMRALLARYFEQMKRIIESHGGAVEKFIGDAVMAVFGVPLVHEDDALRAVRAAVQMRDALPELAVQARIGVDTGEVVTGTEERLATGDAVNVAARLEQAASPGEILIGEATLAFVRDSVETEALVPLELKGKTEPVPAHRLLALRAQPEPRHEPVFVGRADELEVLRGSWQLAHEERRCELVTVVGDAGVGKSRLIAEFLASVEARVVRGRCPPYGEGITYLPVVEVLRQLAAMPSDPVAGGSLGSLASGAHEEGSAEEIAWAFRKLLEEQAPVICVFDDIHWAEKTFLDLVEHVGLLSTGAPLLVLCMARPELAEGRPDWPVALRLEPLPDADVEALIPDELSSDLRARISATSGGNPLFVTEMVALATETDGDVSVPPTLRSLLAARLDQLGHEERSVLERAAVEGEVFHRGAVQALLEDGQVTPHLAALVRRGLIRHDRPALAGEDAFRFRHILIRDAAYDALPKAARAELHLRLAGWLEQRGEEVAELDEILGYHLELAARYGAELGLPEDHELTDSARRRLHAAGQRAVRRQDYSAARSLFERAANLVPSSELDLVLETELAEVLFWDGRPDEALTRADALIERAATAEDSLAELCAKLHAGRLRLSTGSDSVGELGALVERALPLMEATDDPIALYIGYCVQAHVEQERGRNDLALRAFERAFDEAGRVSYQPPNLFGTLAFLRFSGSTSVAELLAWLDQVDAAGTDQFTRAYRGWSLAKLGRFDEARAIIAEARRQQAERGGGVLLANLTAFEAVGVELLAGDIEAALEFGREGCRMHEELGTEVFLSGALGLCAESMYQLERLDEAERLLDRAEQLSTDVWSDAILRLVRAKLLARMGSSLEAERLVRESIDFLDPTDLIDRQGEAYATLADVFLIAGKTDDAVRALEQSLDRFERKGNLVMARRVREQLEDPR